MRPNEPLLQGWQARLALDFVRRDGDTVLARREHRGPLRVQKSLYPEGREVCHAIVLHPPAGIAGGDELEIDVAATAGAHALLTTPGAAKWYRSSGAWATQQLRFDVGTDAVLEWLPQPSIVFDAAQARMTTQVNIATGGLFFGWETLCFGRTASGEHFDQGALQLMTRIDAEGTRLWLERGNIAGGSKLLASPVGLAGRSVCATLLVAGQDVAAPLLADCRSVTSLESGALHGITVLPRMLVARYLGNSAEAAQEWLIGLWYKLRPALTGREAQAPRIWAT